MGLEVGREPTCYFGRRVVWLGFEEASHLELMLYFDVSCS